MQLQKASQEKPSVNYQSECNIVIENATSCIRFDGMIREARKTGVKTEEIRVQKTKKGYKKQA